MLQAGFFLVQTDKNSFALFFSNQKASKSLDELKLAYN